MGQVPALSQHCGQCLFIHVPTHNVEESETRWYGLKCYTLHWLLNAAGKLTLAVARYTATITYLSSTQVMSQLPISNLNALS